MEGEAGILQQRIELGARRAAPGSSRVKGLEVKQHESEEAERDHRLHASTRACSRGGRLLAEERHHRAEDRQDRAPRAAASPRDCPRARRSCRSAAGAEWELLATAATEKSERDEGMQQRAEGDGDAGELGERGAAGRIPSAEHRRAGAPTSGTHRLHGSARSRARTRAKWPNSVIMAMRSVVAAGPGLLPALGRRPPVAARLQGLGDFRRHVFLVMLGQDLERREAAVGLQAAFDHHALALAEEIGQHAAIGDGQRFLQIGHAEADVVPPSPSAPRCPSPPARRGGRAARRRPARPSDRWGCRRRRCSSAQA